MIPSNLDPFYFDFTRQTSDKQPEPANANWPPVPLDTSYPFNDSMSALLLAAQYAALEEVKGEGRCIIKHHVPKIERRKADDVNVDLSDSQGSLVAETEKLNPLNLKKKVIFNSMKRKRDSVQRASSEPNSSSVAKTQNVNKKKTIAHPTIELVSTQKELDITDDFYTNPLSLSKEGVLAIALGNHIHISQDDISFNELLVRPPFSSESTISNNVTSLCWINDDLLAAGTECGYLEIWDIRTKKILALYQPNMTSIVAIEPINKELLSLGCADGSILVTNIDKDCRLKVIGCFKRHKKVCNLALSCGGQYFASGGNDRMVNVWSASTLSVHCTFSSHKTAIKALAWNPQQTNLLATGGGKGDNTIKLWNVAQEKELCSINTEEQVSNLHWMPDGKHLISTHGFLSKRQVRLWKFSHAEKEYRIMEIPLNINIDDFHTGRVFHSVFSLGRACLFTAGADDKALKKWSITPFNQERFKSNLAL